MISCSKIRPFGRYFLNATRLYLTAFPKIERHPVRELFEASSAGKAEFLALTEDGRFIGLAYMIVRGRAAFLLYFAVKDRLRNRGFGSRCLKAIQERYSGRDVVLLIESLHEKCDNLGIRTRRKGFYLRNGFHDSGLIQSSAGGEANYDILSTNPAFDREAYCQMLAEYPFKSYLEEIFPAGQAGRFI